MKPRYSLLLVVALLLGAPALAFCGFYVAKADTQLFNRASKVVLARDGQNTVVTMASDYQGSPSEFAVVVPVPTIIRRNQIRVIDPALVEHIDAYSAPRLVEYTDDNPCELEERMRRVPSDLDDQNIVITGMRASRAKGVTIEARYEVGEYDILILSATQSNGLVTWLTQNGYRMPSGAAPVIASYLKQNMKFFVAKVNLKRRAKLGTERLRPLQVSYVHRKFMLPIRLGTVNAKGPQDLFIFTLTRHGRVETTNYRTVKMPSDVDVPLFVQKEFPSFYKATFSHAVAKERMRAVFLEYGWANGSCDPCSVTPLSSDEAAKLGARWAASDDDDSDFFVTRLHVRYSRATFPEDLMFQETSDEDSFQSRYVLRHKATGDLTCQSGRDYTRKLVSRWDEEAANAANLTGWRLADIKVKMRRNGDRPSYASASNGWWGTLWSYLTAEFNAFV